MRLSVILAPGMPAELELSLGTAAVVIDVLRFTTTLTAALEAGAKAVYPVAEPEDAWRLQAQLDGDLLLGGERAGLRINGFDLGNSPREYVPGVVGGHLLAMTTSNGTGALLAAHRAGAAPVYVGSLRNAPAVARRLVREGRPAVLYCSGNGGKIALEDVVGAGAIISGCVEAARGTCGAGGTTVVHGTGRTPGARGRVRVGQGTSGARVGQGVQLTDTALIALAVYRQVGPDLKGCPSQHCRRLVEIGFEADVDYASELGASEVVGEFDGVMVRRAGHALRRGNES